METPLKILMLEDSEWDAGLIHREITKAGINCIIRLVNNRTDYETELKAFVPEVIISDHALPYFSSIEAFDMYLQSGLNIPFILVTGTVSEEFAVSSLKRGIDDYVLKNNLIRLPPSILHALKVRKTEEEKRLSQEQLKESEMRARNFATHLNSILEEERARISREIHDELGQQLTSIKFALNFCKDDKALHESQKNKIIPIITDVDRTINTVKKIATELRPAILDSFGLIPAIEWMSKEFEKKTNISCRLENAIEELIVEDKVSINLFRICQETLNNIAKHSGASEALIEINRYHKNLTLKISDNGKGIESRKLKNALSMGIIGMHERAKIIGARLNIKSGQKTGTSVKLSVAL